MSIINVPVGLTDPDNLIPVVQDYATLIPAMTDFLAWYSARLAYVSLDGSDLVISADSRPAGGPTFSQGTESRRPAYMTDEIGGFGAFSFDGGDALSWGGTFPTGSHTKVVLFKVSGFSGTQNILSASTGERHMLYVAAAGDLRAVFGASATQTVAVEGGLTLTAGQWHLAMASWDQSTGTGKVSLDGGEPISATNSAAVVTNPSLFLGASTATTGQMTGMVADAMLFSGDLLDAGRAADLLVIKSYYRDVYGIGN